MAKYNLMGSLAVATLAILAMSAALATLINVITADAPPSIGRNCNRECIEGQSLTCQFEFDIQRYQTFSWACKDCNDLLCLNQECIKADGVTRFVTVVNRMLPGPSIEVCEGDTVRVIVKNSLPSAGVSIHWHGMNLKDDTTGVPLPYMDGQPGVTQCHIMPNSKFTYAFKANPSGTHFWHAQSGFQRGDGVVGALVVRTPPKSDPNFYSYDVDLSNHIILINDWTHMLSEEKFCLRHFSGFSDYPKSILVNGLGPHEGNSIAAIPQKVPYQKFEVQSEKRYRFRMISAAFLNCPVSVSVKEHSLTVIATDGATVLPKNVSSIVIHPGERWDFVIHANQYSGSFWINFMGAGDCFEDEVYQVAVLQYVDKIRTNTGMRNPATQNPKSKPRFKKSKPSGTQVNGLVTDGSEERIGLVDLRSSTNIPEEISKPKADITKYLEFNQRRIRNLVYYHPFFFNDYHAPEENQISVPQINNYTFLTPATPLLLQKNIFQSCDADLRSCEESFCECVHLVKIPLGSLVDLVIVDEGKGSEGNVIHLHGYRFYVLQMKSPEYSKEVNFTRDSLKQADSEGLLERNLDNPILKDTVPLPSGGYVILRFLADNPGFWTLESHLLFYSEAGMKLIFQVGNRNQIPDPPTHFPSCGDFR